MRQAIGLFPVAWRIALREMRGGLRGFYIFMACIALGTGAIAAVNSVSSDITQSISAQGRNLLAGDLRFELNNREANTDERAFLAGLGEISETINLRSMARLPDGSDQSLVEIKAVDGKYPLYGKVETQPDPAAAADWRSDTGSSPYPALVAPLLLDRLGLKPGSELLVGDARFRIAAALDKEPDALSEGFGFAPRLMTTIEGLKATGLLKTGSLVEHAYRIKLNPGAPSLQAIQDQAKTKFPAAGWSIRTSNRAAPALTENVERFSQFLTLVGLTALIVGGVGVANAVSAFLDSKRTVIATLKCIGAPSTAVIMVYCIQIMLIAAIGIALGLLLGIVAPIIAARYLSEFLPLSTGAGFHPAALVLAALFGLLTTAAFSALPLGRAREIPATALLREGGFERRRLPSWPYLAAMATALVVLAALAIWTSQDRYLALLFMVAMAGVFLVLRLVAAIITLAARHSPTVHFPALRLAISNIHRPGALTTSVVLSLGLGLSLLVSLALIDGNLRQQLSSNLPEKAPNFFFIDIQGSEIDGFRQLLKAQAPKASLEAVPMLRGRILAFNDKDVAKMEVPSEGRWVLRGDRGITYADRLPQDTSLTAGEWWDSAYKGEPLVSFSDREAKALGLKIGDSVTVNVLGRNITARIANFRKVDWESLSINFVMVFSPNTFAGAPHAWLATLSNPDATAKDDATLLRTVTNRFPTITSVRVKDALDTINHLVDQLAFALRAAASVALVASVLVLSGALAAGNRGRTHDAVIIKTLGATRRTLMRAFTFEYVLLGLATAIFALLAGGGAAWYVLQHIMKLPSDFLPGVAVATVVISIVTTVTIGLVGTWRVLGQSAAPVLREL
ncbi:ABC transporter permease [Rhizobium halophytocola]|uniref:ABC transport system permease protein n=1 Tax=Rhizobium halophytocola TaxID=735519 RepID=A0ABS4E307_9HYPH|nr:ABC transporter permease [Rhizobium halophytocola]MBP1852289.1 putative ABC transport system permease protein [Rhizobium halophytocola]